LKYNVKVLKLIVINDNVVILIDRMLNAIDVKSISFDFVIRFDVDDDIDEVVNIDEDIVTLMF